MALNYSRLYARFNPDDPAHRHGLALLYRRMLLPHLPAELSTPILDVGCGQGYALHTLRILGYQQLQGIDTDAGQVEAAQAQDLAVTQVHDTAAYLSEHPGTFGLILLMDVLEHVPREKQPDFLRAIAGALRPGGRLLCTVPNAASAIASYWLHNDYTHQWSFTTDSLSFLLEETGFEGVECRGIELAVRPRFLFWLPTRRTLAWWFRCALRFRQRRDYIAELGWTRGRAIVLTPNLLAIATKAA